MRTYSILGVISVLGAAACAGSQGERVTNASMEEADEQAATRAQTVDADQHARENAIDQNHEAAQQNIAAADMPAQGASQTRVDVSQERATYQSQAKARLDKLGIRIDAVQQKLNVLGNRAPTALRGDLATTTTAYQALERDVTSLSETPPANWEATTDKIDQRMDGLDQRVSALSDKIEEV